MWPALPVGDHTVAIADRRVVVRGDGGPAAAVVDGLPPDTELDVVVDGSAALRFRTLAPPPGRELCRFATISDIHVGEGWTFGVLPTLRDPAGPEDPPVLRAARAALDELRTWGAQHLVVKGDITHHGRAHEFTEAAALLGRVDMPVVATRGNHDVQPGHTDGRAALAAAGIELVMAGVAVRELPGLRVVVADATIPEGRTGTFDGVGPAILDAAASAPGPVLVALHHQLQRLPFPTYWPPGVPAPASGRFLRALAEANPQAVVTSGHTHRHRVRTAGPVLVTEVGSVKDHPGTWAGYVVHEGGIRQVVRRVAAPEVIRWTEETRRALFGAWGRWSPGRLDDRCVSHRWPRRPAG